MKNAEMRIAEQTSVFRQNQHKLTCTLVLVINRQLTKLRLDQERITSLKDFI